MDIADTTERLRLALPEYGITPEPERVARLAEFLCELEAWNRRVRLVGSVDPETLVRRHVGESLALAQLIELDRQQVVDVGSGGGFPGLVLQLAFPGLAVTMLESQQNKARFLQAMVVKFGCGRVLAQRGEEVRGVEGAIVTARALERMEQTAPKLDRLRAPGGWLALWLTTAQIAAWQQRRWGWEWGSDLLLPDSDQRRIALTRKLERGARSRA